MNITFEDIELALKILRRFLKQYEEAEFLLRKYLARFNRTSSMRFEDKLMERILEQTRVGSTPIQSTELPEEEELTEEELKRFREIARKYIETEKS